MVTDPSSPLVRLAVFPLHTGWLSAGTVPLKCLVRRLVAFSRSRIGRLSAGTVPHDCLVRRLAAFSRPHKAVFSADTIFSLLGKAVFSAGT